MNRWISPFMPRQNSEEGWVGADGVGTEADEPEAGEEPEVPEESEVPEGEVGEGAGHPFHGGGRWHAPAMCSPPWKMVRVGRMDFLNPRWWPVGSGPWANLSPIQGSAGVSFNWLVGNWAVLSGGTRVTWELRRR